MPDDTSNEEEPSAKRMRGQSSFVTMRGALENVFNEHPVEYWVPWGLSPDDSTGEAFKYTSEHGRIARGQFLALPEGPLLDIASFLAPHELDNYLSLNKALAQGLSKTDSAHKMRLASCIGYYSILKIYADRVQTCIVGGWTKMISFLTAAAHKLQDMYNGYEVHRLHRALVAEQIIGVVCNFQGLLPYHPMHMDVTPDMDQYEANRQPQELNIDGAFPDYNDDEHLPHVHWGDLSRTAMFEYGSVPPKRSHTQDVHSEDGRLTSCREEARVSRGLLPVILIYREEDDGNEIGIGFGGGSKDNEQRVFQWEESWTPNDEGDEAPSWTSELCAAAEFPRSIVATFCLDMRQEHTSRGDYYHKYWRELAWLWAHHIPPFDIQDKKTWLGIIKNCETKIRVDNRTNYGTDDPFGRKKDDDSLFAYVRAVVGGNQNYTIAKASSYVESG